MLRSPRWRRGLLAAVVLAVAACGETAWPKIAAETTCAEWTTQMTDVQREAMGAAMLLALRAYDGSSVRPPEEMLDAFGDAVGDVCATTPAEKVSSVAATIYALSDDLKP